MRRHHKLGDNAKREKIQKQFWNEVGSVEHISLPRLRDAIQKEFNLENDRFIKKQVNLMLNEQRIRIESKVKVWIRRPAEAVENHRPEPV